MATVASLNIDTFSDNPFFASAIDKGVSSILDNSSPYCKDILYYYWTISLLQ